MAVEQHPRRMPSYGRRSRTKRVPNQQRGPGEGRRVKTVARLRVTDVEAAAEQTLILTPHLALHLLRLTPATNR